MEIYLLFLFTCLIVGLARPRMRQRNQLLLIFGMALLVSFGYFVFRLV